MKKLLALLFLLFLGLSLVSCGSTNYSSKSEDELARISIERSNEYSKLSVEVITKNPSKALELEELSQEYGKEILNIKNDTKEGLIKLIEITDNYINKLKKYR